MLFYLKRKEKYQGPPKTGSIWIPAMLKTGAKDLVSNRQICPKRYDNDGLAWSENSLESQVGTIQLEEKNEDNVFMRSYFSS